MFLILVSIGTLFTLPRCAHFSTLISPSWITEQISVEKCAHRGTLARQKHQTSFNIVTWTKQTWTKHHNTHLTLSLCPAQYRFVLFAALDMVGGLVNSPYVQACWPCSALGQLWWRRQPGLFPSSPSSSYPALASRPAQLSSSPSMAGLLPRLHIQG